MDGLRFQSLKGIRWHCKFFLSRTACRLGQEGISLQEQQPKFQSLKGIQTRLGQPKRCCYLPKTILSGKNNASNLSSDAVLIVSCYNPGGGVSLQEQKPRFVVADLRIRPTLRLPLLGNKPLFTIEWRLSKMDQYTQLELFDLRPYTSEPAPTMQPEEVLLEPRQDVDCIQLELDLFPKQSQKVELPFLGLAA